MCDLARDMNRAMRVVEKRDFLDDLGDRVIRKIKRGQDDGLQDLQFGKYHIAWYGYPAHLLQGMRSS